MYKQTAKIKKNMSLRESKGITLIALAITIIVLFILSVITITTLIGENGILIQAENSKEKAEIEEEKEVIKIAYMGAIQEANGKNVTADLLNNQFNKNGTKAEATGTKNIKVVFETGRSYIVDTYGNIEEYIDVSKYVKVGDYVDYHPDEVKTSYNKFEEIYSGFQNNSNYLQDTTLQWRVLNINDDGTIDLISNKAASIWIGFQGARGYNNAVAILNDYCKTMYSNTSKHAEARSINIDDIQDHMKTNEDGKKQYENYTSESGTKYKTGYISYSVNRWYPLQWKNDTDINKESIEFNITPYMTEDEATEEETEGNLTVTQTYWYLDPTILSTSFELADTRNAAEADTIYYKMLCNNESIHYWLASRCTHTQYTSFAYFCLGYITNGTVRRWDVFASTKTGPSEKPTHPILPIVSLPSNVIDLNTDYQALGKWNLK